MNNNTNNSNNNSSNHRAHQTNLTFCLIPQNKLALQYIPNQYIIYYINSKRRFFLYFKYEAHMLEVMRIFDKQNVKYYRRDSLFPDREELQQILFHCNFKHKHLDLRRQLKSSTFLNQPKGFSSLQSTQVKPQYQYRSMEQSIKLQKKNSNTNMQVELKQNILKAQIQLQKGESLMNQQHVQSQMCEQTQNQYAAQFGHIKIRNPQVLNIINNKDLLKRLFQAQKLKPRPISQIEI